jgi:hypothetical protein
MPVSRRFGRQLSPTGGGQHRLRVRVWQDDAGRLTSSTFRERNQGFEILKSVVGSRQSVAGDYQHFISVGQDAGFPI